ncbi:MAG: hypothetical protein G01um10145_529 [Microgenomates group bacterium Gr01-1014_5]|nr:MAG: hypothetical protein G01um10145_529 [Microgenomates group bacterium Gr01-1014_5]
MAGRLERFRQTVVEHFRPEIKIGTLGDFIEVARLARAKEVLAQIGERKVLVQPDEQISLPRGYDEWEYYTKFTAKGLWGKRISFTQTTDTYALPRAYPAQSLVGGIFNNSLSKTDKTKRILSDQGFRVTVKHHDVVYSEEEFRKMVRKANLIGIFAG